MTRLLACILCLACTACGGGMTGALEGEMVSSLQYDATPCTELVAQRDALAAAHGLGGETVVPNARPSYLPVGAGPAVPDLRSQAGKERGKSIGEVAAMDRSIERRKCRGE